jgi:AhpD family alkylhydroperoxidase
MKVILIYSASLLLSITASSTYADEPPSFMKQTYPAGALQAAWGEYQAVYGPAGAIDAKHKQLIALGVAAQIPCEDCILAHSTKAREAGATEEEIKEALAVASLVRKWNTVLNGYDKYIFEPFREDMDTSAKVIRPGAYLPWSILIAAGSLAAMEGHDGSSRDSQNRWVSFIRTPSRSRDFTVIDASEKGG